MVNIALNSIKSGRITRKINQVGSFEFMTLPTVTGLETNEYFTFDIDEFDMFIGVLRKVQQDKTTTLYSLYGESAACRLKDKMIVNENGSTYNAYSAGIIQSLVAQCYLDGVNTGQFSFSNIDCGNGYYFPSDAPYFMPRGTTYLSHINTICLMNNWNWYEVYDTDTPAVTICIRKNTLSTQPTVNLTVNQDFVQVQHKIQDTKQITSVSVPGINWQVANNLSAFSLFTPYIMKLPDSFNESILEQPMSTSTTHIYVENTTGYPNSGNVRIWSATSSEDIQYTSKDASKLISAARTGIVHYPGDPVLLLDKSSFALESIGDLPAGVKDTTDSQVFGGSYIRIGSEVCMLNGTKIERYYGGYPHRGGTWVSKWVPSPTGDSAVAIDGLKQKRIDSSGLSDRDHLDKLSQGMLKRYSNFYIGSQTSQKNYMLENVTGKLTDIWLYQNFSLGDTVEVDFNDSVTYNQTKFILSGITFNWPGIADVELGLPDDYVLESIASISSVANAAITQPDKDEEVTVKAVSSATTNVAYVQKSDGTYAWTIVR